MIIQEAKWEKRNLGVTSCNFVIEKSDTVSDLSDDILDNRSFEYQTVKLPVNMMTIHNKLNDAGFSFAEGKFELVYDLRNFEIPAEYKQLINDVKWVVANSSEEQEFVFKEIRKGIFDTDKIALDPCFGINKAADRYVYWSKDILEKGNGILLIVKYQNMPIGFVLQNRITNQKVYSTLGGLFKDKGNDGYGLFIIAAGLLETQRLGFSRLCTEVSSNNVNVLKLHLALGANIKSMYYVMTKHI